MFYLDLIVDSELLDALLKVLNISHEFVSLSFGNEDLLWIHYLDAILILLALRILVLNVKDAEESVLACWEQSLVIKTDSQSLYRQTVSLYLKCLIRFEWILKNLNRAWLVIFRNTSEECSASMHLNDLRNVNASIIAREFLLELVFDTFQFLYSLVSAYCEDWILSVLFACNTWEVNVFKFEFVDWVSILLLALSSRILLGIEPPHEYTSIPTSWDEVRIIVKPLNASDLSNVSFIVELSWAFCSIELVDADVVLVGTSK